MAATGIDMLFNIMRYITEKLSPTLPEGMVNVEAADMANIDNLIESCKSVIEVRARWMCLDFEAEDVQHQELPDGHIIVALTHVYGPRLVDEASIDNMEEYAECKRAKIPVIYLDWSTSAASHYQYSSGMERRAYGWLPKVRVQFPQLVIIILPDGTVKKSDDPQIRENAARRELRQIMLNSSIGPAITKIVDKCKLTEYTTLEQMITTGHSDVIDGTPCQALEK